MSPIIPDLAWARLWRKPADFFPRGTCKDACFAQINTSNTSCTGWRTVAFYGKFLARQKEIMEDEIRGYGRKCSFGIIIKMLFLCENKATSWMDKFIGCKKSVARFAEEIVRIIIRGLVWWTNRVGNFLIKLDLSPN